MIESDNHGRIRVSDVLCVSRAGIVIDDLFNAGFELGDEKRQFVVAGVFRANENGELIFPGRDMPDDTKLVPVLFLLKRYEVGNNKDLLFLRMVLINNLKIINYK